MRGKVSAKTEAGLQRWLEERRAEGCNLVVWKVEPLPEVEAAAQAAAGSSR